MAPQRHPSPNPGKLGMSPYMAKGTPGVIQDKGLEMADYPGSSKWVPGNQKRYCKRETGLH